MNKILFLSSLVLTAAAFAQEATKVETKAASTNETYVDLITGKKWTPDSKWTIEQLKARDERVFKKTGGFIYQAAEGDLTMLLDAREKATGTIDEVARLYKQGVKLDINTAKEKKGDKCPLEFAKAKFDSAKPLMLVVVVEDSKLPALSVFPEERIGLVNASRLKGGNDPSAPEVRVAKEIWRAMGFIGGIGFSQQENDMMQPYYTLEELDRNIQAYIQPMNMLKMDKFFKRFGVKKARKIPYRVAVKEGWANAPTNDYQKAVWEEEQANKGKKVEAVKIVPAAK